MAGSIHGFSTATSNNKGGSGIFLLGAGVGFSRTPGSAGWGSSFRRFIDLTKLHFSIWWGTFDSMRRNWGKYCVSASQLFGLGIPFYGSQLSQQLFLGGVFRQDCCSPHSASLAVNSIFCAIVGKYHNTLGTPHQLITRSRKASLIFLPFVDRKGARSTHLVKRSWITSTY